MSMRRLVLAIQFLTRLPTPPLTVSGAEFAASMRWFPAVGLIVGGLGALVFGLFFFIWPKTLAILASMAATLYVTGAFHEDGWGDTVDGFGGGWEKAQILTIMKDSRIGSFGAIALVLILLAKFFALIEIEPTLLPVVLIAGHAFSRLCSTSLLYTLDYVRDEGKAKPLATRISKGALVFAALTALVPMLLLPPGQMLLGVAFAALATVWLARMFKRRIGGYTGDCLGAVQQFAEVAFYAGLLCRFS